MPKNEKTDWKEETKKHILKVQDYIFRICECLKARALFHDNSKLESPEAEIFEIYTEKLKETTYGSEEYKQFLSEMKPALDHHYKVNAHHPECFEDGIRGMTLIDLTEMLCDWKAATMRHNDGSLLQSLEINQERFGYSDELKQIFINTANYLFKE